ncbi:dihydrolipoyl dehydrogenase [Melghirimyces algeriensis]|uniref:Dihydrolipoyl dehydrogenase n=1 Tax=Melghirimyces algeriensis TaxID=910412 RepID=A0A521BDN4_9BACL|nr:dihydrolipoyl dehydrogenase [Melghirimyces algeriensis]SMO45173.1 dihydrolipoamide dehydrogenase [Melghirimyces algeriensis]
MNSEEKDVVIIGGGPGGYVAAIRAAQLGKRVMLIDNGGLGGTCLTRGCIPSKALITVADRLEMIRHSSGLGINIKGDISIDLDRVMKWKKGLVEKLTGGVASLLKANRVEVCSGTASFLDEQTVKVDTNDEERRVRFHHCVIATGAKPIELKKLPFDGERVISSTEALQLKSIPQKLLIVGGGYIGLELGTAYQKLGSEVTILEGLNQILPGMDPSLVNMVTKRLKQLGVTVKTDAMVTEGNTVGEGVEVRATVNGSEEHFHVNQVLVAVGRVPNTHGLELANASVETDEKGFIRVDDQLRTSGHNIFAIGDVVGGPLLAHKASFEGKVVAEVINGEGSEVDYQAMPYVIFSDPEIAYTGLQPREAKEQGYDTIVSRMAFQANGRALTLGVEHGFIQIVSDKETHQILGAQIVGPEASTLISEVVVAIEMGMNAEDLSLVIHAHPTLPEVIQEAAEGVMGKAIHMMNRI